MKILICSSTYDIITHGPAKFTRLFLEMEQDYPLCEIRLLSRGISNEVKDKKYKIDGWYPRYFGIFWEYFDNIKYYKAISRLIPVWKPDLIVFVDVVLGYLSAKKLKIKDISFIGLINDYEYLNNSFSNISFKKDWFLKWKSRFLEKAAVKNMDRVITNSNHLSLELSKKYGIHEAKIRRIYKAIKLDDFPYKRRDPISLNKRIDIVFIKSDYIRGGLYELLNALNRLSEYSFNLYICGPPENQRQKIIEKTQGHDNTDLIFEFRARQERVKELLYTCDIFCTPALREALGVANIEALATGIPVVSSDAGGINEVLDYGNNGWVSRKGDIASLSTAIRSCLMNSDKRLSKSRAGREYVERLFGHKQMYQDLLDVFKEFQKS